MHCCHREAREQAWSAVIPSRADGEGPRNCKLRALASRTSQLQLRGPSARFASLRMDTKGEAASLHEERCGPELFNEFLRSRRRNECVSPRLVLHHASHRADADKVLGHHLFWNAEKED
jgi:hypothetical protein